MMPDRDTSRTISVALSAPRQHCLLLGAKGAGMTALAEILTDLGHHVTGLDTNVCSTDLSNFRGYRLLPWSEIHADETEVDLCVASPAISLDDPLLQNLRSRGIPTCSLHECLAQIFASSQQICVAGTHGKSTTSAMLAWILECAGCSPAFFVGAHQSNFSASGRGIRHTPEARFAVLESCEYSQSFHQFSPAVAVLTGIERDHFDCFPEQATEDAAFREFLDHLPNDGAVVYNAACDRSRKLAKASGRPTIPFGINGGEMSRQPWAADWNGSQICQSGFDTTFQLAGPTESHTVRLPVPGRHNVANAIAAIVGATTAGVAPSVSCQALASFRGIQRRFEFRGLYHEMTLIDDYAHHPTAIETTLRTARAAFPGQRIIAAFEPHQITRTDALFPDFVNSLLLADEILLLPAFPARENVSYLECCRTSGRLVRELGNRGGKAFLLANLDQVVSRIDHSGKPMDIILTMGAGRTNLIHDELIRRLQRHSAA